MLTLLSGFYDAFFLTRFHPYHLWNKEVWNTKVFCWKKGRGYNLLINIKSVLLKLGLNGGGGAFNFTKKYAEKRIFKCEIDTTCILILVMLFKL